MTETPSPIQASVRVSSQNIRMFQVQPGIRPCFRCGKWGYLVANCAKPRQSYPSEQPLVREIVSIVHDVHTVCVNDTELDALCEIDESCVSTKGVDEELDRVLSGATANLQQKAGSSFGEGNDAISGLTPDDTSHEVSIAMDNKYWEIQEEGPGSQIIDVQGRLEKT